MIQFLSLIFHHISRAAWPTACGLALGARDVSLSRKRRNLIPLGLILNFGFFGLARRQHERRRLGIDQPCLHHPITSSIPQRQKETEKKNAAQHRQKSTHHDTRKKP